LKWLFKLFKFTLILALVSTVIIMTKHEANAYTTYWVSFSATTSSYWTNVRSGPSTSYSIVRQIPPCTRVYFDGYTYGQCINDLWLNTPDYRWYKVAGRNEWIASAVVYGNAPGSSPYPPAPPSPKKVNLFRTPVKEQCQNAWPSSSGWYYGGYARNDWAYPGLYHTGIDINKVEGDYGLPVYATADGEIVYSANAGGGWGNVVVIKHNSPVGVVYSLYGHLSARTVYVGQKVAQWQQIGNIGGTGGWASHLHFEIKNQDCVNRLGLLGPGYTKAHPNSLGYFHPWEFCVKY